MLNIETVHQRTVFLQHQATKENETVTSNWWEFGFLGRQSLNQNLDAIQLSEQQKQFTVYYYHVLCEFQGESTLYSLPECQGTPCSKQAPYLEFKW